MAPKIEEAPETCKLNILGIDEFLSLVLTFKIVATSFKKSPTTEPNEPLSRH